MSEQTDLSRLVQHAEQRSGLLAPLLAAYLEREHITLADLAAQLECPPDALSRLWLCEQPRTDQFAADVQRIATYAGASAEMLERVLTAKEGKSHDH